MALVHATIIAAGWPCSPRLVQHALALLHLPHVSDFHHVRLEQDALLQLKIQRPQYALSVFPDRVRLGLFNLLLDALRCDCPACCPSSKRTEALLCALLQSDLRLGLLPHLFSSP